MRQIDVLRQMGLDPEAMGAKTDESGNLFKPDADPKSPGRCEICGAPGLWICGAGQVLCHRHQDDY